MKKITLDEALERVVDYVNVGRFVDIRRHLDPTWIDAALHATGTATLRKRRLPAEQVVWLVLGMALYRRTPINDLVDRLDLVLPGNAKGMAGSAVVEARARLGADPIKWLFEKSAKNGRTKAHEKMRGGGWRFTVSMDRRCVFQTPRKTELTTVGPPASGETVGIRWCGLRP